jgi:DUF4097 and DUF4098 domain-containing protein YvlB
MIRNFKYLMVAIILLSAPLMITAGQSDPQKLKVPLSDPSKPGLLKISINVGDIYVEGYRGKEIDIETVVKTKKISKKYKNGLKLIPNLSHGLTIEEEDNVVYLRSSSHNQSLTVTVKVPLKTSLQLKVHNGGRIYVKNVQGNIETKNYNGSPLNLDDVSGTINAYCPNGNIKATVSALDPDQPHSFYAPNGTIDVTLPANTKANLKMRTINGNIYSDFEITLRTKPPEIKSESRGGKKRWVLYEKEMTGTINGGGKEIKFIGANGNIYIRKK